eukprot:TRINITY_DN6450_c0_g1_i1.p1 TRINITY_DN6450_c0_g1~~TRINITY_DN6450_c0_g1_i1.p1  ORF type:complete len:490 (+),score=128.40 TRINITY_DN6450_c0_g1_i1:191-1471(+)
MGSVVTDVMFVAELGCVQMYQVLIFFHVLGVAMFTDHITNIIVLHCLNQEKLNLSKEKGFSSTAPVNEKYQQFSRSVTRWLLDHKQYFGVQLCTLSKLVVLLQAVISIPAFMMLFSSLVGNEGNNLKSNTPECANLLQLFTRAVDLEALAFASLLLMECIRRLTHVKERYYLRQEMLLVGLAGVWASASLAVYIFVPVDAISGILEKDFSLYAVLVTLMVLSVQSSMWMVLYKVHQEEEVSEGEKRRSSRSRQSIVNNERKRFHDVLENDTTRAALQEFLLREFAIENLLIWEAIEKWKFAPAKLELAREIYDNFCSPTAKLGVNLSHIRLTQLKELFENSAQLVDQAAESQWMEQCRTVFEGVQFDIFELMFADSFRRFGHSKQFLAVQHLVAHSELDKIRSPTGEISRHHISDVQVHLNEIAYQ